MNTKTLLFVCFLLFLSLTACKKDKIGPQFEENSPLAGYTINILNEGAFNNGTASITTYNPYSKKNANNSYYSKNGVTIGDVLQSAKFYKGNNYLVVNNSGKIIVTDSATLAFKKEITGFISPRYMECYQNKAFVTDFKANGVYVVDLNTHTITSKIPTQGWTESILLVNNYLYVLELGDRNSSLFNQGNNHLYKINPVNHTKVDSMVLPMEPNSMVLDKDENLWVLSSGAVDNQEIPQLTQIDLANFQLIKSLSFPSINLNPTKLETNAERTMLYYLNQDVYSLSIYANEIPLNPIVSGANKAFYGFAIDPLTNELYLGDSPSFTQNGRVYRYYPNGELIHSFEAGIGPSFFQF